MLTVGLAIRRRAGKSFDATTEYAGSFLVCSENPYEMREEAPGLFLGPAVTKSGGVETVLWFGIDNHYPC